MLTPQLLILEAPNALPAHPVLQVDPPGAFVAHFAPGLAVGAGIIPVRCHLIFAALRAPIHPGLFGRRGEPTVVAGAEIFSHDVNVNP